MTAIMPIDGYDHAASSWAIGRKAAIDRLTLQTPSALMGLLLRHCRHCDNARKSDKDREKFGSHGLFSRDVISHKRARY
jgi:hypothetical protein